MDRSYALRSADFGRSTAERDLWLTDVFVETDLYRQVFEGETDFVLGSKGSGKSAIYHQLHRVAHRLRRRGVIVVGAESPAGDPVFSRVSLAPDLSTWDLVGLWKLYFLTITVAKLRDLRVRDRALSAVAARLQAEGLLPPAGQSVLVDLFNRVLQYADVQVKLRSQVGAMAPPMVGGVEVTGRIVLHEPAAQPVPDDAITASRLLLQVGEALVRMNLRAWILVDRLDTAFISVSEEVESAVLRALIQTYIDVASPYYGISLKLFLRDDVWQRINGGVPIQRMAGVNVIEPSHLEWSDDRLVDLLCRRVAHNRDLCRFLGVDRRGLQRDGRIQAEAVKRLFPTGSEWSFASLLERLRDGDGHVAPREVIRFMREARDIQVGRLESRAAHYAGNELFESATLESAVARVSRDRLFQVMCAEYPHLHQPVMRLVGSATEHTFASLARLWGKDSDDAARIAAQLRSLSFFDRRNESEDQYRIAPLYRAALASR